ncbi:peptide-methionine (S)-S-oxide reductase MsrA [Vibrio caribbeanicus]|uniref:peptide-methionine (S)-S-oxide reductase MsrA n=1 Tax=Vibrio caribbeanicus TaxID=701175 RepID=UPI0022844F36|nr:peptide-methionine (S)-S-oxide reductase MsrA [Vibrio caribbeanicus]MCY9845719.1 peptide-methionine (S)-S-oxide reductase MsrA [Vibrio caribbeanicus]
MQSKNTLVTSEQAYPGRDIPIKISRQHFVNGSDPTLEPASGCQKVLLGMGCFWGAERLFWQLDGVITTSVGYAGGYTPNPTYQEVCTGMTGHTEIVRIVFDPRLIDFEQILKVFWENHNPTQGMRQGNDQGTQYRSAIYVYSTAHYQLALDSKLAYQSALGTNYNTITTEIETDQVYYFAEDYHQQYLAKNPNGYCGIGGTGICYPPENS